MAKVLGALTGAGVMAGFMAVAGMVGAWVLVDRVPFSPYYGRAALWGLIQLGFMGLTFVMSIRNLAGLTVFAATLVAGAGWGAGCLGLFRLAGHAPGPYEFSAAFMASSGVLAVAAAGLLSRKPAPKA